MMYIDLHRLVSAIAFALLHSLWQVSLLGLCAACSFTLMRRAPAWRRHAAGMCWMLAMVALPLLWCIGYVREGPAVAAARMGAVPSWTDWLLPVVTLVWLAGVVVMLALRWGGWLFLRRIDGPAPGGLPPEWERRVDGLRASLGIARRVTVRAGARIATPFTAYVLRPVVWIPLELLTGLPPEQLTALIAHELAHVRRLDWVWNLVQHCVESVLFYHPAMWWLSRRVREERELACDALAAEACGDPVVLAEALAHLHHALRRGRPRAPAAGLALAAQGGVLHRRVAHLVQDGRERACDHHHGAAGLLLVAACLCCALAAAIRMPHALLVNMQVQESMSGPLTAGNYREFSASYLFDARRDYRVEVDGQGRRIERYREDGVARPVDGQVRAWVAAMSAMHTRAPEPAGQE